MATENKVLLRDTSTGKSTGFAPDHAERILAYPGTLWEKVTEEAAKTTEQLAPAKTDTKEAPKVAKGNL